MSLRADENDVRSLQRRAEQAIRTGKPRDHVIRLLEQLVTAAPAESDASRFAHRHLAELLLETSPWRAALHLRTVLAQDADDDVAQALMGLCQALMANFRSAVSAYRRAVALAPGNPWYNHNLGHLLDVALGASREALPYLRRAHRLEPSQVEVAASLAHCLGRTGAHQEGTTIARALVQKNPREADLRALLEWLERGAPPTQDRQLPGLLSAVAASPPGASSGPPPVTPSADARHRAVRPAPAPVEATEELLSQSMLRAGHSAAEVERAARLWNDYRAATGRIAGRPAIVAAAVEYALCRVDGASTRQRELAERYGISLSALQTRYAELREVLKLAPRDPRYARGASARATDKDVP